MIQRLRFLACGDGDDGVAGVSGFRFRGVVVSGSRIEFMDVQCAYFIRRVAYSGSEGWDSDNMCMCGL